MTNAVDAAATPPLDWQPEALWSALQPRWPGATVEIVRALPSTNGELMRRARDPALRSAAPTLLVAETQTEGRGRLGRRWHGGAAPGASLALSIARTFDADAARGAWDGLTLACGVAVADALEPPSPAIPARLGLKWPNDVLLRPREGEGDAHGPGRKVAGLLVETLAHADGARTVVVGVGVNVRRPPDPDDGGLPAAGLVELDARWTAPQVLARLAPSLLEALDAAAAGTAGAVPPALAASFARRDVLAGRRVVCEGHPAPRVGHADGLGAGGALRVVDAHGVVHLVGAGDVRVRPRDDDPAAHDTDAPAAARCAAGG